MCRLAAALDVQTASGRSGRSRAVSFQAPQLSRKSNSFEEGSPWVPPLFYDCCSSSTANLQSCLQASVLLMKCFLNSSHTRPLRPARSLLRGNRGRRRRRRLGSPDRLRRVRSPARAIVRVGLLVGARRALPAEPRLCVDLSDSAAAVRTLPGSLQVSLLSSLMLL